MLEPV